MKQINLAVAETFLSIQGEGKTIGIPSYFLRLAGCNLMCGGKGTEKDGQLHNGATWRCDTIEVWLKGKKRTHDEVFEMLGGDDFLEDLKRGFHLVITGGEPLLQQDAIIDFLAWLYLKNGGNYAMSYFVEIETNGTIKPSRKLLPYVNLFNVSPKLKNSGTNIIDRYNPDVIESFAKLRAQLFIFKFVITNDDDIEEIESLYFPFVKKRNIYLMPGADNRETLNNISHFVAEKAINYKCNYSTRLHIQIWDQKTGV